MKNVLIFTKLAFLLSVLQASGLYAANTASASEEAFRRPQNNFDVHATLSGFEEKVRDAHINEDLKSALFATLRVGDTVNNPFLSNGVIATDLGLVIQAMLLCLDID